MAPHCPHPHLALRRKRCIVLKTGDDSLSYEQPSPLAVAQARYEICTSTKLLEQQKQTRAKKTRLLHENIFNCERGLNSFKIGLLFGFFVDSFKVGS